MVALSVPEVDVWAAAPRATVGIVDRVDYLSTPAAREIPATVLAAKLTAIVAIAAAGIRRFETGPMSIQNRLIFYSAKLRSEGLEGKAFLEMWCNIPGQGEFFSRVLDQPVSGTTEWTTVQTPFRLEAGQMPGNVKLNIVIEGSGTVWIDDIKLFSAPLN